MTLREAIRDAIAAEKSAEKFYGRLAKEAKDLEAQAFFEGMRDQERDHAVWIEKIASVAPADGEPGSALGNVRLVETLPDWSEASSLDLTRAVESAIEAEHHAAMFYDAIAGGTTGEIQELFLKLQRAEESHASGLERLLADLQG